MTALVFIDTNILLDFYRVGGTQGDLTILAHIDENHDKIITSDQVAMEFKKNRPKVIADAFKAGLKPPVFDPLPAFLAQSKQATARKKMKKQLEAQIRTLKKRTQRVLENPARNDLVYKVAQRLFRADTPLNLSRTKAVRLKVRRLARKRFELGYPPRKDDDTSMGDAVNWEWIVHCATETGNDVVIVSRDTDYGIAFEKTPILNDWLLQEFRDRTSKQRSITLTRRLSEGFQKADIKVTKKQEEAETTFLQVQQNLGPLRGIGAFVTGSKAPSDLEKWKGLLEPTSARLDRISELFRQAGERNERLFREMLGARPPDDSS